MSTPCSQQRIDQLTDLEKRISHLPEKAKAWLRAHPEFITDNIRNGDIANAHLDLIAIKGTVPFSPAYFEQIETKLGVTP